MRGATRVVKHAHVHISDALRARRRARRRVGAMPSEVAIQDLGGCKREAHALTDARSERRRRRAGRRRRRWWRRWRRWRWGRRWRRRRWRRRRRRRRWWRRWRRRRRRKGHRVSLGRVEFRRNGVRVRGEPASDGRFTGRGDCVDGTGRSGISSISGCEGQLVGDDRTAGLDARDCARVRTCSCSEDIADIGLGSRVEGAHVSREGQMSLHRWSSVCSARGGRRRRGWRRGRRWRGWRCRGGRWRRRRWW